MNERVIGAIERANLLDRTGLILYTIPNFPDPVTYRKVYSHLCNSVAVSVIETTMPVTTGFSSHANDTITRSHRKAAFHNESWKSILSGLSPSKPHIMVLYEQTCKQIGFETIIKESHDKVDGVLLEWNEKEPAGFAEAAQSRSIEFITCVGHWMKEREIDKELSTALDTPLVYLMSAPMTGGRLFSPIEIIRTVEIVKKIRPHAKIAAGFGINGEKEIRQLNEIGGIDAVIIGTSFLKEMEKGEQAAIAFLQSIEGAL